MTDCAECGYEFESLDRPHIVGALTALAGELRQLLDSADAAALRARPWEGSWSALEYGCHVRDVLRFQRERVAAAQVENVPTFTSMRRDERAIEEHYNDQDPRVVGGQFAAAAGDLAAALTALDEAGWLRTGVYPWPVRRVRTVEWIGRRTVHELAHHLFDCQRLLAAQRG